MTLTFSSMMNLGSKAPDFRLYDTVSEKLITLHEVKGSKATVITFICNHCPYVHHINNVLVQIAKDFKPKGVNFVAISANDAEKYPEDSPEKMKEYANKLKYPFPYLYDETQKVAFAYDAVCTPDNFIFNENLELAYRGRFDDSRPGNGVANGNEIKRALQALIAGQIISEIQYPSMGCNIKWIT